MPKKGGLTKSFAASQRLLFGYGQDGATQSELEDLQRKHDDYKKQKTRSEIRRKNNDSRHRGCCGWLDYVGATIWTVAGGFFWNIVVAIVVFGYFKVHENGNYFVMDGSVFSIFGVEYHEHYGVYLIIILVNSVFRSLNWQIVDPIYRRFMISKDSTGGDLELGDFSSQTGNLNEGEQNIMGIKSSFELLRKLFHLWMVLGYISNFGFFLADMVGSVVTNLAVASIYIRNPGLLSPVQNLDVYVKSYEELVITKMPAGKGRYGELVIMGKQVKYTRGSPHKFMEWRPDEDRRQLLELKHVGIKLDSGNTMLVIGVSGSGSRHREYKFYPDY
ncbi:MAG: hypothetical protein ACTSUE_06075 [Promethearchaeota archaeon]